MTHCSIVNINHRHRLKNDKLMLYVFQKDIAYPSQLYQVSSQCSLEDNSRGKTNKNKIKRGMSNIFPSTAFMAPYQPYRAQDSSLT